ncbi:MAG: PAS domain-containing protein [Candidatus Competibacteraceae bacterium]|nr:PAS domain-containing protein [Candidatus Competibacteraceae bacterium]
MNAAYQGSMTENRPGFDMEYRVVRENGEERLVYAKCNHHSNEAGQVIQSTGMVFDITERKRSENALIKTRNLLAEAQKIAQMGSFEYIAATQTTVWSEEEYRLYGLDPTGPSPTYEEMLEKCIHPDDKERLHEVFTQAMRNQGEYELEHRIVRPEGSVRWEAPTLCRNDAGYHRAQAYRGWFAQTVRGGGTKPGLGDDHRCTGPH